MKPLALVALLAAASACGERAPARTDLGDAADAAPLGVPAAPRYTPRAAGLCASAPAELRGAPVWTDEAGLWTAPREATSLSPARLLAPSRPGATPTSPLALAAAAEGAAAVAVAWTTPEGCLLRLYDAEGRPVADLADAAQGCLPPAGAGRYLAWPLASAPAPGAEGARGRVAWVDSADGREVASLDLGASPLTAAAAFGTATASGGGSHWLVGTTDGAVAIADPLGGVSRTGPPVDFGALPSPAVAGAWSEPAGRVTTLVVAGDHAALTLADAAEAGLGHRLRLLRLGLEAGGQVAITPVGAVIEAPGPVTAHPVAFACPPGAPSAWYCPSGAAGTVVAAGEGWVAGWHLPSGAQAFERTSALAWTGLALGRSGWVMGGGSHWRPGDAPGWRLVAFDPLGDAVPLTLASGPSDACVPSPLWDSAGDVSLPIADGADPALLRASPTGIRGGLGLAEGQPRPLGDARNASIPAPSAEACADGVLRGLSADAPIGDTVQRVVYGDGRAVAVGARGEQALIRWLPGARPGAVRLVPEAPGFDHAVVEPGDVVVTAHFEAPGPRGARLVAYAPEGPPLWAHALGRETGAVVGLARLGTGTYAVGLRLGESDLVVRASAVAGVEGARQFFAPEDAIGLEHVLPDGAGGAVLVVAPGTALVARRLDADLALGPEARWPEGRSVASLGVVDASTDAAGALRVLVEVAEAGEAASLRWLRFAPDLTLVDARPIPFGGFFATLPQGDSLLAAEEGLVRVSALGAVGLPRSVGAEEIAGLHPNLRGVAVADGGFVVGFWRPTPGGVEFRWGEADAAGFLGCAQVGLCAGQPADRCDDASVCALRGCDPALGACAGPSAPVSCVP